MKNQLTTILMVAISAFSYSSISFAYNQIETIENIENKDEKAKTLLMSRLAKFDHFTANFSQQVLDEENNTLQQAAGTIAVKKPNLVSWQTQMPEESHIVSDGETLWFYDPFIEQATAYNVNSSVANTPILLLTSSDKLLWGQYDVSQKGVDHYLIHSKDENARVKSLELNFIAGSAQLASFSIMDSTGQLSLVKLTQVNLDKALQPDIFTFTLPEGVYLDDQR